MTQTSDGVADPEPAGPPTTTPARVSRRIRISPDLRARWAQMPLTGRLLGILLVLLVVAIALTGWGTQHVLRDYLVGRVDAQLGPAADGYLKSNGNLRQGPGGQGGGIGDYVVRVTGDDGQTVLLPSLMHDNDSPLPDLPKLTSAQADRTGRHPFTVGSARGDLEWRAIAVSTQLEIGNAGKLQNGSVVFAIPLGDVRDAVAKVRLLIEVFGLLVTLVCGILGWLAIRQAFRPLVQVEETAAAIAAGDLSRRVPEYPASTEVGRLTRALNGMLAQIESAFRHREASEARTRRFAADASHELRTPLASIRGFAELYRQGAVSDPDDVARTMGRIEDEAKRMGGLVEDLLLLARLDEQRPGRHEPVDLAVLAGDATHDARGLDPDRAVTLVGLRPGSGPVSAVVTGDDNRLRQVVANLVANAVRHTPAGTPIEIAAGRENGTGVLEVRDHGPGLSPQHAVRVFERFYRVDRSRSRGQGGGSGLGLSIVAAVVSAHGGRVGVAQTPGGGATFRLELPLATPAGEPVAVPAGRAG